MTRETTENSAPDLRRAWTDLRAEHPHLRIRDAAARLGVSEAQLLATGCGEHVTRLAGEWGALLKSFDALGPVMALTRNDVAVHEKNGRYSNVQIFGPMGQVLDEGIDLRLFLRHWHMGFAVRDEMPDGGVRHSFQFFDADGGAVHKVYLDGESDHEAFETLTAQHASKDQSDMQETVATVAGVEPETPDADVDTEGFRAAWRELHDTHEFHVLLKKFGVTRTQALRIAGTDLARRVAATSFRATLEQVAAQATPIMVFVGNAGVIQIHSGPVKNIKPAGGWLNVLDPGFNLHVREDDIAAVWVVRKRSRDEWVTSLEMYDTAGQNVVLLYGKRQPDQPEPEGWRAVVESLPTLD